MICPKCFNDNVTPIGDSHYMCNNPECCAREGKNVQFNVVQDKKIKFPYNQIFVDRLKNEFFRKPYLQLAAVSNVNGE